MKNIGGPVAIGGDNLPSPVRIGLTNLQNIGPGPPGSGTTDKEFETMAMGADHNKLSKFKDVIQLQTVKDRTQGRNKV